MDKPKEPSAFIVRRWISAHPIYWFYALTIILSWSYWLTLLVRGESVEPGSSTTHLPGLMGPMLAAIIVTAVVSGKTGLQDLALRAVRVAQPRWRNILLMLSPLLLALPVFLILPLFGTPLPAMNDFYSYPGVPTGWPIWILFIWVLFVNGYGEELGWRGFATHHLLATLGKFRATLMVTVLWMIWHIPLFWLNTNMHDLLGPIFFGWAFGLLCAAFVLAWVYINGGNSILAVAVWHTLYNFAVATPAGVGIPAAIITTLVMVWGIVVGVMWWRNSKIGSR